MPVIELETQIDSPIDIVFDLSRSIDLHVESTAQTKEKAVAGRTSGLIGPGEDVTWEATHFWVRQQLTTRITEFDRPHHFRDSMVAGAFSRFDHDHHFSLVGGKTLMIDTFDYTSPLGVFGRVADILFLERYMTRLLQIRNDLVATVAESGEVEAFLNTQAAQSASE